MADSVPSPTEKNRLVTSHLGRLWTLTIFSLVLNGLILVLLVVGAVIRHHQSSHFGFMVRDREGGGRCHGQCHMGGWGHHFHHFGGMGMSRGGDWHGGFGGGHGWGGGGFAGHGGGMPSGNGENFGKGPGDESGPGSFSHGPGGGFFGGGAPDPAKFTDGILDHLSSQLSLTDEEKTKIKPIIQEQVTEMQRQMEAQRQAFQKQIEDAKAKIKPLLDPDQQKQLDALPIPGQKPDDQAKTAGKTGP